MLSIALLPSVFIFFSFLVADHIDRRRHSGFWLFFFLGLTLSPVMAWLISRLDIPGGLPASTRMLMLLLAIGFFTAAFSFTTLVWVSPAGWFLLFLLPAIGLAGAGIHVLLQVWKK